MYDTNVLKSDDIIFRCKIILSFENIYKIFSKYTKDQEHPATTAIIVGSKKTARLKLEMFRINNLYSVLMYVQCIFRYPEAELQRLEEQ